MHFSLDQWCRLALPLLLVASLSACALGRTEVDVPTPVGAAPTNRVFVKIVEVKDLRHFEVNPDHSENPSLGSASEVADKSITSRAIARKRSGYGMALGDVVLPPGKTVAGIVRAGAVKALQDKGYTVVQPNAPAYAAALPISIDIDQFWAWEAPNFGFYKVSFNGALTVRSDSLLIPNPKPIEIHTTDAISLVFDSVWGDIVRNGNDRLSDQIGEHLRPAF